MTDRTETTIEDDYEYAGFHYTLIRSDDGVMHAIPNAGQHAAASKQKHCMAAIDCWRQDQGKSR